LLALGLVILPLAGGTAQEQSWYERAMARRLAALECKLQYINGGPNEVVISGANLRIVNGLGSTETTNGLGNLIVGYNELRTDPELPPNVRTGSHNMIVGKENNFSSFAGLVVGNTNEISGQFSSGSAAQCRSLTTGSWIAANWPVNLSIFFYLFAGHRSSAAF
jgi:hypothetical protein